MRIVRAVLLSSALLCAQLFLAAHGIGHAFHHDDAGQDEACIECLMLSGMQGATATASAVAVFTGVPPARVAVPPVPTIERHLAFYGRAPPLLQG